MKNVAAPLLACLFALTSAAQAHSDPTPTVDLRLLLGPNPATRGHNTFILPSALSAPRLERRVAYDEQGRPQILVLGLLPLEDSPQALTNQASALKAQGADLVVALTSGQSSVPEGSGIHAALRTGDSLELRLQKTGLTWRVASEQVPLR